MYICILQLPVTCVTVTVHTTGSVLERFRNCTVKNRQVFNLYYFSVNLMGLYFLTVIIICSLWCKIDICLQIWPHDSALVFSKYSSFDICYRIQTVNTVNTKPSTTEFFFSSALMKDVLGFQKGVRFLHNLTFWQLRQLIPHITIFFYYAFFCVTWPAFARVFSQRFRSNTLGTRLPETLSPLSPWDTIYYQKYIL